MALQGGLLNKTKILPYYLEVTKMIEELA